MLVPAPLLFVPDSFVQGSLALRKDGVRAVSEEYSGGGIMYGAPARPLVWGGPSLISHPFSASRTELHLHQMAEHNSFGMGTWPKVRGRSFQGVCGSL